MVQVICVCGKKFETTASRIKEGRGRFCSRACAYENRTRPSGLTYNVVRENPTSFKPGQEPWNKGLRGTHFSAGTEFKSGEHRSPGTEYKRSDVLTYGALHLELRRIRGPASAQECMLADATCKGPMHWANVSGRYENVEDFAPLCQSHHFRQDKAQKRWGGSTGWVRAR